ncbi:MAG TPA: SHOCT domain-containing protein [Nitrososphaeraceae archaeon]|nr:SHOCT domain-containing protein [Nitrososphaeraceae archaeon]
MSTITDNDPKNRRRPQQHKVQAIPEAESIISNQVYDNRRNEIHEYLRLFGYKPDKTIIQVHITGFFRKKGQQPSQKEKERHTAAVKRYGGTSFVIVGRTHDPSIIENVVKPKKKNPLDTSPGYVGYLWKNKDPQKRAPHDVLPLDFTPIHLPYPTDWKNIFATKGFMLALHVPSSFAKDKNRLTRALYRLGKSGIIDVKNEWTFLNDIKQFGFNNIQQKETVSVITKTDKSNSNMNYDDNNEENKVIDKEEDPVRIIKRRLAKGEISKEEYEELRKSIES